jgi:hypothetical protein
MAQFGCSEKIRFRGTEQKTAVQCGFRDEEKLKRLPRVKTLDA